MHDGVKRLAEKDFYSEKYEDWINYVRKMRKKRGWSWEETYLLGKSTKEECHALRQKKSEDEDDEYTFLSDDEWEELIDYLRQEDENAESVVIGAATTEDERYPIRENPHSAWSAYMERLQQKGFSKADIHSLERATNKILQQLKDGSRTGDKTVHGLVIGNVQSGKTANMEGLMSMAADAGFNMFIILSGTIESLRMQTRTRMAADLVSKGCNWKPINHPNAQEPEENPSNFDLTATSQNRYYTVCLKNSRRLAGLLNWLNHDEHKKRQMKVLIIDDESDQASLNTRKMLDDSDEDQERTAINKIIMSIVNGNTSRDEGRKIPFKAMNYIAYTATPYGNVLNENGKDSLYPSDFIVLLSSPDTYFGPKQIFGDSVYGTADPLPIINEISVPLHDDDEDADTAVIENINIAREKGESPTFWPEIPVSLKEAIAWFAIVIAIRRYEQSKKPVTMLVHHSMKTSYHISTAKATRHWYAKISTDSFIKLCKQVYEVQTQKLTKKIFADSWSSYGRTAGINPTKDIIDYPPFDVLISYLKELKENGMDHITLTSDGNEYQFSKGIHLCVDNSTGESVSNNADVQVRLLYPKSTDEVCDGPAFLIVGGNTLSRGLTLEGLVCTYFSRNVSQADTLMQMGRWFGYRRGYELLPRIWMTAAGVEKFQELSALDIQLRSDIQNRYWDDELRPEECGPMVAKTIQVALTASNKMQGAEELKLDFSGQHLQTFKFPNDEAKLAKVLENAEKFINSLGESVAELTGQAHRVWQRVSFGKICQEFLNTDLLLFGQNKKASDFCDEYKLTEGSSEFWNVILQGKKSSAQWHGVGKVTRSRLRENFSKEYFNIGTLGDPNVWKSDLPQSVFDELKEEERDILSRGANSKATDKDKSDFRKLQDKMRQRAGIADMPRLVIYCIDHEERPKLTPNREPIDAAVDVIGAEIFIPKRQGNGLWKSGYQLRSKKQEG